MLLISMRNIIVKPNEKYAKDCLDFFFSIQTKDTRRKLHLLRSIRMKTQMPDKRRYSRTCILILEPKPKKASS
ncbi:Uncharacterized protein TCM_026579 [Theobroma cacao]|uniref:Uncharacterized protein n=1 Tax=Theobroma cacao TaxID=3641 RepID=A0A061F3V3_THECC|nr:Uncharacterized protein TCM_026579 [Theobroma cacao]